MFTKQDIEKYFLEEKQLAGLFIFIGVIAIILAVGFFIGMKANFTRGAAIPLLAIGLLQLLWGANVYHAADARRISNVYAYDMHPAQLKNEELPRMQVVVKHWAVLRWAGLLLLLCGLGLAIYCRAKTGKAFWYGLGLALALQALIIVFGGSLAAKKALAYTTGMENHLK